MIDLEEQKEYCLYAIDLDSISLIRYNSMIQSGLIFQPYTYRGSGLANRDVNIIDGKEVTDILIKEVDKDFFDKTNIIINEPINAAECLYKEQREIGEGKNILNNFLKKEKNNRLFCDKRELPIVLHFSLSPYNDKFSLELELRKLIRMYNNNVYQVGTKAFSQLFGMETFDYSIFSNNEKIDEYIKYCQADANGKGCDYILISIPGGISDNNKYKNLSVVKHILTYRNVCMKILSLPYCMDWVEINQYIKYMANRNILNIDAIHISNIVVDWKKSDVGKKIIDFYSVPICRGWLDNLTRKSQSEIYLCDISDKKSCIGLYELINKITTNARKEKRERLKEKKLPISPPLLNAYPEIGQLFSIIDYNNSKSLDWMFSNFVQIYVQHKRRLTYVESLPLHYTAGHKVPTLYHYCVSKKIIENKYGTIVDFIIESIETGYYVSLILDRFYLSNSFNYQKNHKYHNILIYGYDSEKRIFFIQDNESKYLNKEYSYQDIKNSYCMGFECDDFGVNAAGSVMLVERIDNVLYEFNIKYLINELEFYLNSYNSKFCENYNIVRHYRAQLPRVKVYYFNFGVYDYFKKMLIHPETVGGLDKRACYVFYEHKCFMKKRIFYLQQSKHILNTESSLYNDAEIIEKKSNVFLNDVLKIMILQQKNCLDKKETIVLKTLNLLKEIELLEINFIRRLLDELKRACM